MKLDEILERKDIRVDVESSILSTSKANSSALDFNEQKSGNAICYKASNGKFKIYLYRSERLFGETDARHLKHQSRLRIIRGQVEIKFTYEESSPTTRRLSRGTSTRLPQNVTFTIRFLTEDTICLGIETNGDPS
ncbi:TPA: hypothetical protein DD449_00250 [Candidatus Berkelbacteria bacterium]|uniref:Uncharacterized protein n=1 Tax=Berkelbacteria bacterium GW2011_GWE1_39_12 TaxID=1618337 RepID=A0A0G4B4D7_9BACT|nr:MAG: hypothetical protein UT28_C0001G0038 [Berkelbacteria bacterium GW2011_GWE1_39_12]HBO60104.1 hypothetical protein [Candidatus Berkelbacteria bacterium]